MCFAVISKNGIAESFKAQTEFELEKKEILYLFTVQWQKVLF